MDQLLWKILQNLNDQVYAQFKHQTCFLGKMKIQEASGK
jgi:hypothetical protein